MKRKKLINDINLQMMIEQQPWEKQFDEDYGPWLEDIVTAKEQIVAFIKQVEAAAYERAAGVVEELVTVDDDLCSCRGSDCGESVERRNNEHIRKVVPKAIRDLKGK